MSQVGLLSRAIERLETLKAESTPGPWEQRLYDGVRDSKSRLVRVLEEENEYGYDRVVSLADYLSRENASTIVTLRRTLDAQLALLRNITECYGVGKTPRGLFMAAENLARTILGEDA